MLDLKGWGIGDDFLKTRDWKVDGRKVHGVRMDPAMLKTTLGISHEAEPEAEEQPAQPAGQQPAGEPMFEDDLRRFAGRQGRDMRLSPERCQRPFGTAAENGTRALSP